MKCKQVKIAGGHTDMTYAQACNAAAHGMIDFTHCGNAMRGIHHREVGTLGAAMLLDDCYCEVIASRHVFVLFYYEHLSRSPDLRMQHVKRPPL